MIKNISILGSTGSIGTQTLDVARNLNINVLGISANENIDLLEKQIREFNPVIAAVMNEVMAFELKDRVKDLDTIIVNGLEGVKKVAALEVDIVVSSIVGIAGLIPTLEAIRCCRKVALANKETLVTAGSIVIAEAERYATKIIPVDSEHSAIFQCLMGNNHSRLRKIILTASGGPFRNLSKEQLRQVTVEQALKHPNWSMGSKITIDSATLMNKGLEVIEAKWLFGLNSEQIEVAVHPQSIVHSMVEYEDGSIIAQLGPPDMRIPIQFALTYPDRCANNFNRLNIMKAGTLTFEAPDIDTFRCLGLAFEAIKSGGTMPAVLNAANEEAVKLFMNKKIKFTDIPLIIEKVMSRHSTNINPCLNDIIEVDKWVRKIISEVTEGFRCRF